jgi:hypothetical protein
MDAYFMKVITVLHLKLAISQRAFPMARGYCYVSIFVRGAFSACIGTVCGLYIVDYRLLLAVSYECRTKYPYCKWHSNPKTRKMGATSIMIAIARGTSLNISVFWLTKNLFYLVSEPGNVIRKLALDFTCLVRCISAFEIFPNIYIFFSKKLFHCHHSLHLLFYVISRDGPLAEYNV